MGFDIDPKIEVPRVGSEMHMSGLAPDDEKSDAFGTEPFKKLQVIVIQHERTISLGATAGVALGAVPAVFVLSGVTYLIVK